MTAHVGDGVGLAQGSRGFPKTIRNRLSFLAVAPPFREHRRNRFQAQVIGDLFSHRPSSFGLTAYPTPRRRQRLNMLAGSTRYFLCIFPKKDLRFLSQSIRTMLAEGGSMSTTLTWEEFIPRLFGEADPYLEVRGDRLHTRIAHRLSLDLMKKKGGDREIVEPAIILHDVGWSRVDRNEIANAFGVMAEGKATAREMNRIHEIEGAAIARQLLESFDYDEQLTLHIVQIIERHDSSMRAESLEERLVKDADKLWRYSEQGFWKEIERQAVDPRFFYQRLAKRRKEWFLTQTAFQMAGEELKFRFLELEKSAPA
jgi:HD superfamily phosphohydrolase YqeK